MSFASTIAHEFSELSIEDIERENNATQKSPLSPSKFNLLTKNVTTSLSFKLLLSAISCKPIKVIINKNIDIIIVEKTYFF